MAGSASCTYSPLSTASTKINTVERPVRFRSGGNDAGIAAISSNLADFRLAQSHSFSSRTSPTSDRSAHSTGFHSGSHHSAYFSHGIGAIQSKHKTRCDIPEQANSQSRRKSVYADYPASVSHDEATMSESLNSPHLRYTGYTGSRKHQASKYASTLPYDPAIHRDRGSSDSRSAIRPSVFSCHRGHISGLSDNLDFSYKNYYPVAHSSSAAATAHALTGTKRRSSRRLGPVSLEPSCVTH